MAGMVKPKKYEISESNIAQLGSDLEKKVKLAAAQGEDAWRDAGKEAGIQIWRIEKFKVVEWPKKQYGEFYSGDSYIVLHTFNKNPDSDALAWDIHFWLGEETSQDEAGTAAYKTVELDDFLGGAPTQYREVMGHESDRFRSYFPKLTLLQGGIESGFTHVEEETYRSRLLHVKGKKTIVILEVPLARDSMNSGDCFILDAGKKVFQFNGKSSSQQERIRAGELVRAIRDEREGGTLSFVIDEDVHDSSGEYREFWAALGGVGPLKEPEQGGDDEQVASVKRLFRLTDNVPVPVKMKPPVPTDPPMVPTEVSPFDADIDAERLHRALHKFFGKDTEVFLEVLGTRSLEQRLAIRTAYARNFNAANVLLDIRSKIYATQNNLWRLCKALFMTHLQFEAYSVRKAVADGDMRTLVEVIVPKSNAALKDLIQFYHEEGDSGSPADLRVDVAAATNGLFNGNLHRLLQCVLKCERNESGTQGFNADSMARRLFKASEGKLLGTNTQVFVDVFSDHSLSELRQIAEAYPKISKKYKDLYELIDQSLSGDFKRALLLLLRLCRGEMVDYWVERLMYSMKGLGTDDRALIRVIVLRREYDLEKIKAKFAQYYGQTLTEWVAGDTSGDYRNLLLTLIGADVVIPEGTQPTGVPNAVRDSLDAAPGDSEGAPKFSFTEVATGKVTRAMFDDDDVFVFDTGFEIIVWCGKNSSRMERKNGLRYAQIYLNSAGLPMHTPISRCLEGGENEVFAASLDDA